LADRGIDADDLAARIDQRAATVAKADGRVGLDVVVETRIEQLPADEADHADGDGVFVRERVADRAHPFSDTKLRRVAQHRMWKRTRASNLDQCDISVR